jgi:trans-aconitate 2-methyltransferase
MSWSAQQYVTFEDERTRPVRDLVAAIPNRAARRAIDIGCGPGNSTEVLKARYPGAEVSGLDNSEDMLTAARKRLPDTRFTLASIATWREPDSYDVILSNAALQWVHDHANLYPRLMESLAPGGSLAVQTPDNVHLPVQSLMRDIAAEPAFAKKLAGAEGFRNKREIAEWYYALLRPHATRLDVWRTTYFHPLAGGADAVVEWFKGSGLRPFLDPLDTAEKAAYLDRYRSEIAKALPALPDGTVLLPFPRLFIVATR